MTGSMMMRLMMMMVLLTISSGTLSTTTRIGGMRLTIGKKEVKRRLLTSEEKAERARARAATAVAAAEMAEHEASEKQRLSTASRKPSCPLRRGEKQRSRPRAAHRRQRRTLSGSGGARSRVTAARDLTRQEHVAVATASASRLETVARDEEAQERRVRAATSAAVQEVTAARAALEAAEEERSCRRGERIRSRVSRGEQPRPQGRGCGEESGKGRRCFIAATEEEAAAAAAAPRRRRGRRKDAAAAGRKPGAL